MTIHHATAKKAAGLNITLVEGDDFVTATWKEGRKHFWEGEHSNAKTLVEATRLAQMLCREYPAISLVAEEDTFTVIVDGDVLIEGDDVPTLDAILEACEDEGVNPETGADAGDEDEDDEEASAMSAILAKYKTTYAERGNVNHCGDWIALQLDGMFDKVVNDVLVFDHEAFARFLRKNGVDMSGKWADLPDSGSKGWQGRYRMNGRQKLELRVTQTGVLITKDGEVKAPKAYLRELATKHPKVETEWS